jgi:hypothetical protein
MGDCSRIPRSLESRYRIFESCSGYLYRPIVVSFSMTGKRSWRLIKCKNYLYPPRFRFAGQWKMHILTIVKINISRSFINLSSLYRRLYPPESGFTPAHSYNITISSGANILLYNIYSCNYNSCKPGSSVSIVSGYGLDDCAIEVRSPAEAKGFFL